MRERTSKPEFRDDRSGRRAVRHQAPDGALIYFYDVWVGTSPLRRGLLTVRLDLDGELFVSIDDRSVEGR